MDVTLQIANPSTISENLLIKLTLAQCYVMFLCRNGREFFDFIRA